MTIMISYLKKKKKIKGLERRVKAHDTDWPCAQYIGQLLRRRENYTGYQGFCFVHTDGDSSHFCNEAKLHQANL